MPKSQLAPPTAGRAAATRRRLLEAGREAFARKGLAGVNLTRDLLQPAGISVGSFYHQFKDKTDLLLAILAEHSENQRRRFSELHRFSAARTPAEIARTSYELAFDAADANEALLRISMRHREDEDPRIRHFIEEDRLRWRRSLAADYERVAAAYSFELEVELAAELISVLTEGAIHHYLSVPPSERPKARKRLIGGLVDFTLLGLPGLTPKHGTVSDH